MTTRTTIRGHGKVYAPVAYPSLIFIVHRLQLSMTQNYALQCDAVNKHQKTLATRRTSTNHITYLYAVSNEIHTGIVLIDKKQIQTTIIKMLAKTTSAATKEGSLLVGELAE